MEIREMMPRAAALAFGVALGVRAEQYGDATPCPEFDVRGLSGHLVEWTGERARRAARKEAVTPAGADATAALGDGWAGEYSAVAAAAGEAWADKAAWTGATSLGGGGAMPAEFVGAIVFGEWLLHGWDLAVATGQAFPVDGELAAELLARMEETSAQSREYKVFGPEVPVPGDAPDFHRALGLAGRDPNWGG